MLSNWMVAPTQKGEFEPAREPFPDGDILSVK
jgi:hypothetical protein